MSGLCLGFGFCGGVLVFGVFFSVFKLKKKEIEGYKLEMDHKKGRIASESASAF